MSKAKARAKQGGRPEIPADKRRQILIGLRVNPDELEIFRRAAGTMPVTTWVRVVALHAAQAGSALDQAKALLKEASEVSARTDEALRQLAQWKKR